MNIHFRLTDKLWSEVQTDMDRPHPIALERVAFVSCRPARGPQGLQLLAHRLYPVAEEHYEQYPGAAAMITGAAFSKALGVAYRDPVSIFHVHRHEHAGGPRFSGYDLSEARKFVPDFWKVRPELPHGTLVFSHDSIYGLVWPRPGELIQISRFTIVGAPTRDIHHD